MYVKYKNISLHRMFSNPLNARFPLLRDIRCITCPEMHTIIIVDLFLSPWIVYTWLKIQKDDARYLIIFVDHKDVENHFYMSGIYVMRDVTFLR